MNLIKDVEGVKVVIITDLEQNQKSASNAENITDLPKNLQVPSSFVFHNLKPQNAGLVMLKRI